MSITLAALATGLAMALAMFSAGNAFADTNHERPARVELATQTAEITPLSMRFFCAQNQSQCAGGGRDQVTMSPELMALLKQVNIHVNRAIRPRRDAADLWELNPRSGDCEDYVLSKRGALIGRGVSAGALRIAYTHTPRGEPHAVLMVRTSEGDFVLDNLTNAVKTLRASGYVIRSMSSPDPTRWTEG